MSYEYDALSQLTKAMPENGKQTSYSYDAVGNRLSKEEFQATSDQRLATTYQYNNTDELLKITEHSGKQTTYEYDRNGNRTKITDSTIGTYEYRYDEKNQLVYILEPVKGFANPDQTAYEREISYTYDENGNRLGKSLTVYFEGHRDHGRHLGINAIIEAVITQGNLKGEKKGIERNILEILNHILNDEPMVHGEKVGLMRLVLQVIDGCTFGNESGNEYQYNQANQLVKFYDPVAEAWISFEYDGNGNLVKECRGAEVTSYSWDSENRLTGVIKPDGTVTTYRYNAEHKRVSKTVLTSN